MNILEIPRECKQKESGWRLLLVTALALCWAGSAQAQSNLDTGGMTFKDFAAADNGASFSRGDSMIPEGPGPGHAQMLGIDAANGLARLRFKAVKIDAAVPLGWQAIQDQDRGIAYSADQSYRLILWRVDFASEGVDNAEQYAIAKVGTIEARRPPTKGQARRLGDGSYLMVYENVPPSQGDRESRTVFDVITANPSNPKEGVLMTLGVPASQGGRGLKLLALLKQNIKVE